jgi:arylsulfatase A-like enzyme
MLQTLVTAAGGKNFKEDLKKGATIGGKSYKVHLDGYDLGPAFRGETKEWPRRDFIYWTDDGQVAALRYDNWKITFLEQQAEGLKVWQMPFTPLRAPVLANLRMDPFERARHEDAMGYQRWYLERMFLIAPAGAFVGQWLQSFKDFPPRQKPGSFNLDRVMETVMSSSKQ